MNTKVFSDDEQVRRVWDMEEVKDLMARRAYLYMQDLRREEIETLWVQKPENKKTAVFGSNWGFYTGLDNISSWYVGEHGNLRQTQLDAVSAHDPAVKNCPENLGYGAMLCSPLSTALVEIAGDGKTAQGLWYSIGQRTEPQRRWDSQRTLGLRQDRSGLYEGGRSLEDLAADRGTGHHCDARRAVADQPVFWEKGANLMENLFGSPTVPMTAHDPTYNWSDSFPPAPEPYYTYADEMGNCPQGVHNEWRPY